MAIYSEEERQMVLDWFSRRKSQTLPSTVYKKLNGQQGLSLLKIEQILQALLDQGLIASTVNSVRYGKLKYTGTPAIEDSEVQWSKVLAGHPDCQVLLPCHSGLTDWEQGDLSKLLDGLLRLRAELPQSYQLTSYEASARYLLSSSKLLDELDRKSLQRFGIDPDRFRKAMTYVVVAGPEDPLQALLVENPQSFEACIRAKLHRETTLLCTYGYGLQWAQILDHTESVLPMVRAGQPGQDLQKLLSHSKLFFWGDLDYEGIKIYESIRSKLPQCQLSNLYKPMINRQLAGAGHPYYKITGKEKQGKRTDLTALERAVDQECLDLTDLLENYKDGFSLEELPELLS